MPTRVLLSSRWRGGFSLQASPSRRSAERRFGLARAGLLDDRRHTSAARDYLAASGYAGGPLYEDARAIVDDARLLVTAGPQSPVQFASRTLAMLGLMSPEMVAAYDGVFHRADASCYPVLVQGAQRATTP